MGRISIAAFKPKDPLPIQKADAAPILPLTPKPVPFRGYYFMALEHDKAFFPPENYRQGADRSGLIDHNFSRFAYCAYPAVYDWRHQLTFIINEELTLYSIDNGGKSIAKWPSKSQLTERFSAFGLYQPPE